MSSLSDYAKALLAGGLPSVLDSVAGNSQGDTRPEQTAPASQWNDQDTAFAGNGGLVLTPKAIAIGVAGVFAAGIILWAVVHVLKK